MEKVKRIDIHTHNNPIKNEKIEVIQYGNMRFYDDEEFEDWKNKYDEPRLKK